jgi:hypothetical protein
MVNRRDSLTNENIGAHVAGAAVVVAEKMFLHERESEKKNGREKENERGKENLAEKKSVRNVKHRIWIYRRAIPHLLRNL